MKNNQVLVYGTLRPFKNEAIYKIPGVMYDCGWYPGVTLDVTSNSLVVCELIEVTDSELEKLDNYEGFDPKNPAESLYIRRKLDWGPFIYEYNQIPQGTIVESGDWQQHTGSVDTRFYDFIEET